MMMLIVLKRSKVRTNAILSIQAVARADPKLLHAHWVVLLPTQDVLQTRPHQATLLTVLLNDPVMKARMAAASTLALMLESPARAYLQVAEHRDVARSKSFTTLSSSLGQLVIQLHRVVPSSPYSRLPHEMLPWTICTVHRRLRDFFFSSIDQGNMMLSTSSVQPWAILPLLPMLLHCSTCRNPKALKAAVHTYPVVVTSYWEHISGSIRQQSSLPTVAPVDQEKRDIQFSVRCTCSPQMSLRAVSGYKGTDESLDDGLYQNPSPFNLPKAVRLLHLSDVVQSEIDRRAGVKLWLEALGKHFPSTLSHSAPMVRGAALTCFAGLTSAVFCLLPADKQRYVLSVLIYAAREDRTPAVRSSACRAIWGCGWISSDRRELLTPKTRFSWLLRLEVLTKIILGWWILVLQTTWPARESTSILMSHCTLLSLSTWETILSIPCLNRWCEETLERAVEVVLFPTTDPSVSKGVFVFHVRITASWALANVCNALRSIAERKDDLGLRYSLLGQLAEYALKAANDCDKVRANAVRALGNLARFVNFSDDTKHVSNLPASENCLHQQQIVGLNRDALLRHDAWLDVMVQTLVSCVTTGNVKVQWNVCHALGHLFLNKTINLSRTTCILLLLSRDSSNYKIRIHAASALAVPANREDYGQSFPDVVKGLVHALEATDSEHNSEPTGFKYIKALTEQRSVFILDLFTALCSSVGSSGMRDVDEAGVLGRMAEVSILQMTADSSSKGLLSAYDDKPLPPPKEKRRYGLQQLDETTAAAVSSSGVGQSEGGPSESCESGSRYVQVRQRSAEALNWETLLYQLISFC
ncbi:hypothetical protein R1flu_021297 [Riccia fluitans]|uniref:DUF4042 domain-containing protein n=1 Tax=Riccia fluitans TaxID=41844 RepID=A0ABD1ZSC0_9MARC